MELLRKSREDAGLSQRAVAARLGVSPSWVAKVELGERRLDVVEFVRLTRALRADTLALFTAVAKAVKKPRRL